MNSNTVISIIISIALLYIIVPKLNKYWSIFYISLNLIGYNITKNILLSVLISSVITYILMFLNISETKIEKFQNKKNKKHQKMLNLLNKTSLAENKYLKQFIN